MLFPTHASLADPCSPPSTTNETLETHLRDIDQVARLALVPVGSLAPAAPAAECIASMKARILHHRADLVLAGSPKLKARVSMINRLIDLGSHTAGTDQFFRVAGEPGKPEALSLSRTYLGTDPGGVREEATLSYSIQMQSASDGADSIQLQIDAELRKGGKLIGTVNQEASVNSSSCQATLKRSAATSFTYQGEQAELQRDTWWEDGGIQSARREIPSALIDSKLQLDRYWEQGSFPDQATLTVYSDFDGPPIRTEISRLPGVRRERDPITGKDEDFRLFRIRELAGSKPMADSVLTLSTASPYGIDRSTPLDSSGPPTYQERISASLWDKTPIAPIHVSEALSSENFKPSDLTAPALEYAIQAEHAMNFDGVANYGNLTRLPDKEGHPIYDFVSRPVPPAPEPAPIDSKRYTRETPLLDFSDPGIAEIVRSIRAMNLPTREQQALAILKRVNDPVHGLVYDWAVLQDQTIRIVSASEALKSHLGVCQHFAALYVAIARALGIPAKVIRGIGIGQTSQDSTELKAEGHAWVEISLDGRSWTPVEPEYPAALGLPLRGYLPFGEYQTYDDPKGFVNGQPDPADDAVPPLSIHRIGPVGAKSPNPKPPSASADSP